jgi:hypothetical protein
LSNAVADCAPEFYAGGESYTDTLHADLNADGLTALYDASGGEAGAGYWDSTGMSALSEPLCLFPPFLCRDRSGSGPQIKWDFLGADAAEPFAELCPTRFRVAYAIAGGVPPHPAYAYRNAFAG